MRDHLRQALQRKRAAAEVAGDSERVAAIDARLGEAGAANVAEQTVQTDGPSLTAAAQRKADELGLTAEDFRRRRPSGKSGFTVEDVERIAEVRSAGDSSDESDD